MGGTTSRPSGGITREQLLKSTESSRDFTNKLFQLMIAKLTPEDFLKLGNPKTCSSYIFMMADSIGHIFKDLRIRPAQKGDSGVVVFQKTDTLKKYQQDSPESKYLCMTIAYFYIRIFQIFGSLAMTILDDPGAGQVLGMVRYGQPQEKQTRVIPGTRGPYSLTGGGPDERYFSGKAESFRSLRELFEDDIVQEQVKGGWPRTVFTFKDVNYIDYIPDRTSDTNRPQNIRINLDDSKTNKLYANMTASRSSLSGLRAYKITFDTISYKSTSLETDDLKRINIQLARYPSQSFEIASYDDKRTWVVKGGKVFSEKLESIVGQLIKVMDELYEYPQARLEDLQAFKDVKQSKSISNSNSINPDRSRYPGSSINPDRSRYPSSSINPSRSDAAGPTTGPMDVGVPTGLQNEYIIRTLKSMAGYKSVGFCIGRAFQLLDANTLFQSRPQQGISGVCRPVFDELSSSVPRIGQRIDSVPGIKALDSLFYTVKGVDTQGGLDMRIANPAEYAEFLKGMASIFGPSSTSTSQRIDSILARDPNCGAAAAKQYLQIQDPNSVATILSYVNALFSKQLVHTTRVLQFFKQRLFIILKTPGSGIPRVDIHPRLLQGGMAELEKVAIEARAILTDYYKDCESIYRKGVDEVLKAKYTTFSLDKTK
jgi:hypothetical protein